ncbi:MAG: HD domain-containing protein [Paludibacter sp.]
MDRLELVRKEIDEILLNQSDVELGRRGYIHLYGVAQNCTILAIKRGLDIELCAIMGMLHDIYTYKYGYVKEHALLGVPEAEKILRGLNLFTEEEIEIVKSAITNHSDKKTKHDKYSELLKDADLLQNSLYNTTFEIKHMKRLKKVFKNFGIKIKLKKVKNTKRKLE